jgi:OmcA/MtrC family decaheme c-type cytochrome
MLLRGEIMNRLNVRLTHLIYVLLTGFLVIGCDGSSGPAGVAGAAGPPGADGPPGTGIEPYEEAKAESCATCHDDVGVEKHQSIYDKYVDASKLAMTFTSVASVASATPGKFDVTLEFGITKDGLPFIDADDLPSLDQKAFYAVQYDSVTREYLNSQSLFQRSTTRGDFGNIANNGDGTYTLTINDLFDYRPEIVPDGLFDGSQVYGYIAQGALLEHAGDAGAELPAGSHVHLYDDVSNTAMAFGTADAADAGAYESMANVAGCVNCHGSPYMKHGYRDPVVAGLPDFGSCKSCHYDDRTGGHEDWQYMVDDPANWAAAGLPEATVETTYAYKAKLMNDVHMAHAMEFPFPRSMANCATCHEGKLTQILDNANFVPETCKSCHPVKGLNAWPADAGTVLEGEYAQDERAPPLEYLWASAPADLSFHVPIMDNPALDPTGDTCKQCHGAGISRPFNELHTGYDVRIANAAGEKYRDLFTASIDDVSLAGDVITIAYSADESAIANAVAGSLEVHVYVSFYGWDSKHFIVPSHQRDGSLGACSTTRGCRFEYAPGDTNPLFPSFTEVAPGSWVLTADMAAWVAGDPGSITDLITDGTIRKAEITLASRLDVDLGGDDTEAANLDAVTQTFDLLAEASVANYFKGTNAIVDEAKCEACHDQLAVTWHTGRGRGGDIVACRNCHAPVFPGSHVEMASRSVESYVHAIHTFQAFDIDEVFHDDAAPADPAHGEDFDAVTAKRYDQHIQHVFPNFTIRNCEACHKPGTYDAPDQSKSMPGVLSASDDVNIWYEMVSSGGNIPSTIAVLTPDGRNIGTVAETVTGPASRACGGCHRANFIKADDAGGLAAWNAHTEAGGTFVENDADDTVLFGVIDKIMSMFE